jgi:hypothetical protein
MVDSDEPSLPEYKSRLRNTRPSRPPANVAGTKRKRNSSTTARPVVYEPQGPVRAAKVIGTRSRVSSSKVTIDDLVRECQTGVHNLTPSVRGEAWWCTMLTQILPQISAFLVDKDSVNVVRATIQSNHASWLTVARHVASLHRSKCLPPPMSDIAACLMRFEFWISDIAAECRDLMRGTIECTEPSPFVCKQSFQYPPVLTYSRAGTLGHQGTLSEGRCEWPCIASNAGQHMGEHVRDPMYPSCALMHGIAPIDRRQRQGYTRFDCLSPSRVSTTEGLRIRTCTEDSCFCDER